MKRRILPLALLIALTLLLCLIAFPQLPEQIPCHWNLAGHVDGWAKKEFIFLFPLGQLGIIALFALTRHIDPRRQNYAKFQSTFVWIQLALCLLAMLLCLLSILSVRYGNQVDMSWMLMLGMGALFILLGNVMPRIRQNYFLGIKTPWALEDESNWQKTHRFAGRLWFALGFCLMATTLLPLKLRSSLQLGLILVLALLPYGYSYAISKHKHTR